MRKEPIDIDVEEISAVPVVVYKLIDDNRNKTRYN